MQQKRKYAGKAQHAGWRSDRQEKSLPLMLSLKALIDEKQKTLSKKSRLSKAFAYIENHWDALCCYCHDGHVEINNNAAERAIRTVAVGRKTGCSSALRKVESEERCCTVCWVPAS